MSNALVEREVIDVEAAPIDRTLVRMEQDSFLAVAQTRRRPVAEIIQAVRETIGAFPKDASSLVYFKPVGREKKGGDYGDMKFAEGLSIKAALMLKEIIGFNRLSCRLHSEDENGITCELLFVRIDNGTTASIEFRIGRTYTDRYGKLVRYADDRFLNLVVKAEISRQARELILRMMPRAAIAATVEACDAAIDANLDETTTKKILTRFQTREFPVAALEEMIGVREADWGIDERRKLVKLWNAFEEGELTTNDLAELATPAAKGKPKTLTFESAFGGEQTKALPLLSESTIKAIHESFAAIGVTAETLDLVTGKPSSQWGPGEQASLREYLADLKKQAKTEEVKRKAIVDAELALRKKGVHAARDILLGAGFEPEQATEYLDQWGAIIEAELAQSAEDCQPEVSDEPADEPSEEDLAKAGLTPGEAPKKDWGKPNFDNIQPDEAEGKRRRSKPKEGQGSLV